MLRKLLIGIVLAIAASVLILCLYLGYMSVTDYKPQEAIKLDINNRQGEPIKKGVPVSVMTFNIGYCGLDAGEDFFMDGGTMSRSRSRQQTQTNLENIADFLTKESADMILLQEVDIKASRSYKINELDYLQKKLQDYTNTFATNYKVAWVPVPITHPMGSVNGGIITFSRYLIESAVRYQFPGGEAWPRQLAELDRCFIENRLPVEGGKELILINSHFSAYDKGGKIRKVQLTYMKNHMLAEYKKGNYVIVGGDWNHELPCTDPELFKWEGVRPDWCVKLPEDFTPEGFAWAVDKSIPTVRNNDKAYQKDVNFVAVIDGMLVSPNVEIQKVTGYDLNFQNSDHNPVKGIFILK